MKLFRIYNSDGDVHVSEVTEKEILEELKDEEGDGSHYLDELPKESDTNYWPGEVPMLLIRGEIVKPKPKKTTTVESWEIK